MKIANMLKTTPVIILFVLAMMFSKAYGQTPGLNEGLNSGTLREQLDFLENRTRIYDNYRAVREDMFQKMKKNVIDSVAASKKKIEGLSRSVTILNVRIDSMSNSLHTTKSGLDEMTRTKNSIKVLGMNVNKTTYNGIVWTIIAGLIVLLALGFVIFKRNQAVTVNTRKELTDLRAEFEEYRKQTRIAREKMTMDHFNEIKKLRGS
jgi:hypothetical protein